MSPDSRSLSRGPRHEDYLDALRGIAILGVILIHSAVLSHQAGKRMTIAFTGQRGVQLFYMVSAFTLFLTLDARKAERYELSNFFIRRFFRIALLFYLAILGNLIFSGRGGLSWFHFLLGFGFLHGLSPRAINSVAIGGWSIAVETTFYILVPFLFSRIKTIGRATATFLVAAVTLGSLSTWLAMRSTTAEMEQYFAFLWFPVELPVFLLGIVAYLTWKQFVKPRSLLGSASSGTSARDSSMLLILSSLILFAANLPFTDRRLYLSSFLFLPLILGLSLHPWKIFVNRFTVFMGKISYSVYLVHFFVVKVVGRLLHRIDRLPGNTVAHFIFGRPVGMACVYFLVLAISIPICMFTWKYVEQPGIRIGKRWISKREQGVAALQG
jgi:peptidoglycan/LPS O-acetylase OafA/YrhL